MGGVLDQRLSVSSEKERKFPSIQLSGEIRAGKVKAQVQPAWENHVIVINSNNYVSCMNIKSTNRWLFISFTIGTSWQAVMMRTVQYESLDSYL